MAALAKWPYWVTRAHIFAAMQRFAEPGQVLQTAIGLTEDSAVRAYLLGLYAEREELKA